MNKEDGFSLLELAVSCAILSTIGALSLGYYVNAGQSIKAEVSNAAQEGLDAVANIGN